MNARHAALAVGALAFAGLAAWILTDAWLVPELRWRRAWRLWTDDTWRSAASPDEIRETAQQVLTRDATHHDVYIYLTTNGTAESVRYLIAGLRWQRDTPPGEEGRCTKSHCLAALRRLTGRDCGVNYREWKAWWDSGAWPR